MTSASIAQVASATAALCGAAGVTYYAVNVAKVFGGARAGTRRDANGRARAIEGGRARGATLRIAMANGRARARERSVDRGVESGSIGGWRLTMGARAREQAIRCRRR